MPSCNSCQRTRAETVRYIKRKQEEEAQAKANELSQSFDQTSNIIYL